MVCSRDRDDTWCGLGTGTIHGVNLELGICVMRFRDWD